MSRCSRHRRLVRTEVPDQLEYSYNTTGNTDNNGSLREQKITVPTAGLTNGFTAIQTYSYDDLNRIQSATETVSGTQNWKQTFQYDRYGNRRFDANNTTTLLESNNITNPTIDTATNRFSSGQNYLYDKNGNLTEDAEGTEFFYDAENHQKEVKNAQDQTIGLYLYDGDGKRVKKISNTETTIFVYNGSGTLIAEYSTALSPTQQVSYLTQDHLGSPRIITNENGIVTNRKDYTAFGEEAYSGNRTSNLGYNNQTETRKGYTGYERDGESGLDFAQARYYNASHGRFTSVDPLVASAEIKNPQTFNRYAYVLNSPYKFSDPLGLLPQSSYGRSSISNSGFCSAENSYDDCGGDSGFWGGWFGDERANYNRTYGGLSREAVRGLSRYLSIMETGYDPEFGIFRGMYQITRTVNGQVVSTQTVNNPTPQELTIAYLKVAGLYQYIVTDDNGNPIFKDKGNGVIFDFKKENKQEVKKILDNTTVFSSSNNSLFNFGILHKKDVGGGPYTDYRSIMGVFGKGFPGSLQIVINNNTLQAYADVDRFNPYQDLRGFFGHAFIELIPPKVKGFFKWLF